MPDGTSFLGDSSRAGLAERAARARDWLNALPGRLAANPRLREQLRRYGPYAGGALLLVGGLAAWLILRPVPQPDYDKDGLDSIFNYTLLTDEFNKLRVEERMKLITQLVQRLKNMDAGDSALMAAFAAGIAGAARQQIEENASRLAIDVWDKYAIDYTKVPADGREAFIDQAFLDFTKTMEGVAGRTRDVPDQERLDEAHRQAQRDLKTMKDSSRGPSAKEISRAGSFMRYNVGEHATPAQQQRGQALMRDMVRRFRDEDVATGKPKGPG
jgi:hypothetical protein